MVKSSTSPTTRTMEECRRRGWLVDKTEYWQANFAQGEVVRVAGEIVTGAISGMNGLNRLRDAVNRAKRTGPGIRKDLFGFVDLVALGDGTIHAIQCTDATSPSNRLLKIMGECREAAEAWVRNGGKVWIVSWYKYARPEEGRWWRPTWREITMPEFRGVQ